MSQKEQASQCFMCTQHKPYGCLECRTHRLLSDIRSGLYEKMGADQNRAEWEERALKAEAALLTAQRDLLNSKEIVDMREALDIARGHSCNIENDAFAGWLACCGRPNYRGHEKYCYMVKALAAFDALKERLEKP